MTKRIGNGREDVDERNEEWQPIGPECAGENDEQEAEREDKREQNHRYD